MTEFQQLIKQTTECQLAAHLLINKFSKRTKQGYFTHVRQGLEILERLSTTNYPKFDLVAASRAFCLHAIIQDPKDFYSNLNSLSAMDGKAVALTMEYSRIANAGSRQNLYKDPGALQISQCPEVNAMLVADKIQNKYAVELYYPKDNKLEYKLLIEYFDKWLTLLSIDNHTYKTITNGILNEAIQG